MAHSSAEADYQALAVIASELSWLLYLLKELRVYIPKPPIIWCDIVSATYIAANPVYHGRVKHIELLTIILLENGLPMVHCECARFLLRIRLLIYLPKVSHKFNIDVSCPISLLVPVR